MSFAQEPDQPRMRAIAIVALGVIAIATALVLVAWWFVTPAPLPTRPPAADTSLEHGLFDRATGGADAVTRGAARLQTYRWIDRAHHLAQIPIDRAIDAVVADPQLIGAHGVTL